MRLLVYKKYTLKGPDSRLYSGCGLSSFWGAKTDQIHAYGTHDLGGNPSVSIRVPIWVLRRWKVLTSHHRNKSLRRASGEDDLDSTVTVFCKAQARKNKQDKCESLNRVKKVLPSLAPFQLGISSNVAGSPHGDVVFDWVVNCVTAIAQGLVDGKIPASQQI